jgi:hypothetical protein
MPPSGDAPHQQHQAPTDNLDGLSAAADPWNFEGSEALFFAEKTRLGGVRMLLLEGPKAGS